MSHDPHVSGAHAEQGDSTPFGGTRLLTILDVAEFLQVKPKKVYREVDWSLLVMFTGLFVVVHAGKGTVEAQAARL